MGRGAKGVVLVVDDADHMRSALQALLTEAGYSVVTAEDGQSGFRRFQAGGVDLVITDHVMPNLTGLELARAVKRESPQTPVIMVTSDVNAVEGIAQSCGVDILLSKHDSQDELLGAVRTLIGLPGLADPQ